MNNEMQRTVLISGCSDGGIGHDLALQFHLQGLKVFATARTLKSMEKLGKQGIETLELDVTVSKSIQNVKEHIEKVTAGTLDILVNNAGVCYESTASDDTMAQVKGLYAVNLFGTIEMTQTFIPLLVASAQRQAPGSEFARIVQISSVAAVCPTPFYSAYNSSKAAMVQYSNGLRIEMEPFGVKVITISTGRVRTQIMRGSNRKPLPHGSLYTPIKEIYEGYGYDVCTAEPAMPCDEFARTIVAHILSKNATPILWAGSQSWTTWLIDAVFPRTIWDRMLRPMFALDKLAVAVREEKTRASSIQS